MTSPTPNQGSAITRALRRVPRSVRVGIALVMLVTLGVACGAPQRRSVSVVGDSITFFANGDIAGALAPKYRADIHAEIGHRIDEMLVPLAAAVARHPAVVVVNLGTNDALQARTHADWQPGFARMVALLGQTRCGVVTTISTLVVGQPGAAAVAAAIDNAIAASATKHRQFHILNWNTAVHEPRGNDLLMPDHIHPSAAGSLRLAALVRAAVDACTNG